MKRPNFFIIGAPKCGTTSLASWLAEHPNVYIPTAKEINYFCYDLSIVGKPKNEKEYILFFKKVPYKVTAIGDASVSYCISDVAIKNIEMFSSSSPKYIFMIRNPIEMSYALHRENLCWGEDEVDFRKAWYLSPYRRRGLKLPKGTFERKMFDYQNTCKLGFILSRIYEQVPRERVLVLVLDDIKKNPRKEYIKILEFLGIPDDGRTHFPVLNPSKTIRWRFLRNMVRRIGRMRDRLGLPPLGRGIFTALMRFTTKPEPREPLPEDFTSEMREFYRKDVELLSRLIHRDLSHWLKRG